MISLFDFIIDYLINYDKLNTKIKSNINQQVQEILLITVQLT